MQRSQKTVAPSVSLLYVSKNVLIGSHVKLKYDIWPTFSEIEQKDCVPSLWVHFQSVQLGNFTRKPCY